MKNTGPKGSLLVYYFSLIVVIILLNTFIFPQVQKQHRSP